MADEGLTARPMAQGGTRRCGEDAGAAGMAGQRFHQAAPVGQFQRRAGDGTQSVHDSDLEPTTRARQRLAYDELLANQLALLLIRSHMRETRGRAITAQAH